MAARLLRAPSGRSPRLLLWAASLAGAAWLGWRIYGALGGAAVAPLADLAPVRVAMAISQNVPRYLSGLGTVLPSSDVLVKSRVDGQLLRLHFSEGARVEAGDLLAEIDPRPFEAALGQARGNLARDEAQLANARRDLARYRKLAGGDYIAAQQIDAQAALVRQYEGMVQTDRAAVEAARLQLEYSRVTAPVGGRAGLRQVDTGNQVRASDAAGIVRITEERPCDVLFTLPESQVGLVAAALRRRERDPSAGPLPVQAWDREGSRLLATGELLSLDNQIDPATGTVRLKARFANEDGSLFPNQFVNARLLVEILDNAVTVPASAVQLGAAGNYVYQIERAEAAEGPSPGGSGKPASPRGGGASADGIARLRKVVAGLTEDDVSVIEKGVAPGELIAVDGLDRLREGMPVRIAASAETPRLPAN